MRNISTVITQIQTALPTLPSTDPQFDNLTVLQSELRILLRKADYYPVEAGPELWNRLAQELYRYMPPPTATPWAKAVSDIMLGAAA